MVQHRKDKQNEKIRIIDLYLLLSLIISISLWGGYAYTATSYFAFILDSFFISCFVIINYSYYQQGTGVAFILKDEEQLPAYFLAQFFVLMGISFQYGEVGALYLCLLPFSAGIYFFKYRYWQNQGLVRKKTLMTLFIAMGIYGTFTLVKGQNLLTIVGASTLFSFVLWQVGIVYLADKRMVGTGNAILRSIFKLREVNSVDCKRPDENKERYFFHDLINQTHGLNLFLKNKIKHNHEVDTKECVRLLGEVKIIQDLVKNHYGYYHKDLIDTGEFVGFEYAINAFYGMVDTYLPRDQVEVHFVFIGNISFDKLQLKKEETMVHYPSFCRILHNIVKNIAEEKAQRVEFKFNYTDEGLEIIIKNKIFKLKDDHRNLAENLSKIILTNPSSNKNSEAIGLESIADLCEAQRGHYKFYLEDEFWVSNIFLPSPVKVDDLKKAA